MQPWVLNLIVDCAVGKKKCHGNDDHVTSVQWFESVLDIDRQQRDISRIIRLIRSQFFLIEKWKSKDYFIDVLEARFKAV